MVTKLNETKKEDDTYYQGAFWIISDSFKDILRGNFKIDGIRLESDYEGNYTNFNQSQKRITHKMLWGDNFSNKYGKDKDYTFYPRGRVAIYKGTAFIHINSKCNTPKIIDEIIKTYNIGRLEIEIDLNDTYQGGHYDFELE